MPVVSLGHAQGDGGQGGEGEEHPFRQWFRKGGRGHTPRRPKGIPAATPALPLQPPHGVQFISNYI